MGRIPLGELSQSRSQPLWKRCSLAPSRRRPFGYYSLFGLDSSASRLHLKRRFTELVAKNQYDRLQAEHDNASEQKKGALTKQLSQLREAFETLSDAKKRALYNKQFALTLNSSTARSRERRQRISETTRQVEHSLDVARKKLQNQTFYSRSGTAAQTAAAKRKKQCKRNVSSRSQVIRSNDHWQVFRRSDSERLRDRRLGPFLAVPGSQISP